ncbi:hypothetical protein LTR17_002623 [Elasticomyces elasticus]|nr:hypothetical protein LTR17_002623 [Elasticomyces elasticus]
MCGEEVHAYLEHDGNGKPRRLTFLVYHPEAHLCYRSFQWLDELMIRQYRIVCSVLYPDEPIRELAITKRRRQPGKFGKRAFQAFLRYHIDKQQKMGSLHADLAAASHARFVLDLMLDEALLGHSVQVDDLPVTIREHLDYPLPVFDLVSLGRKERRVFGQCALVVNLIASFDRQHSVLGEH